MQSHCSSKVCRLVVSLVVLVVAITQSAVLADEPATSKDKELSYKKDILPIFRSKCFRCHAGVEPKADLNLSESTALLIGGSSGPAIRISAAESSLLYEKIASGEMPAAGQKLTTEEKALIRKWINDGAPGVDRTSAIDRSEDVSHTEWWSFNRPANPKVPEVKSQNRVRNGIDAFILQALEKNGLNLSPEADKLTLLRRATYDLIGVPPTIAEIDAFLADDTSEAYSKMIERLLANEHYGERWGRHWLDVAGYTDSAGVLFEDRPLQLAYKYRNYVIRAFNNDKPYDRFLQEQIAGDELTGYWNAYETMEALPADVTEGITATGFLRTAGDASRPDFSTIKNADAQYYYPTLFDTLQIVCSTTMGLTVQCARCHSHKFDPITQVDYFRMESVFMNGFRPQEWIPQEKRRLTVATKKQTEAANKKNAEIDKLVKQVKSEQEQYKKTFADSYFETQLAKLPIDIQDEVKAAFATGAKKRTEAQKTLFEQHKKSLRPDDKELQKLDAEYKAKLDEFDKQIAAHTAKKTHFGEIRAFYDLPGNVTASVLLRGDPLTPGANVEPGVVEAINSPEPFEWSRPPEGTRSSGRRLAFAKWLTQPEHPLTARVMVNRIWMFHFGVGIVSTPEDFGVTGDPPSHPELLDWLATEFVKNGWSIKHIHRLILNSNTWRQSSRVHKEKTAKASVIDPDNRLLWRQNIQRLEAEPLRDAILATSNLLSPDMYGGWHAVHRLKSGEVVVPPTDAKPRRSIYIQILRLNPDTMLQVFDQPEMSVNCIKRGSSTVATQALTMLNSDMMVRAANSFADRVLKENKADQIGHAVRTAFSRPIAEEERTLLTSFYDAQLARYVAKKSDVERQNPETIIEIKKLALADLCHMLLSANEFAYLD